MTTGHYGTKSFTHIFRSKKYLSPRAVLHLHRFLLRLHLFQVSPCARSKTFGDFEVPGKKRKKIPRTLIRSHLCVEREGGRGGREDVRRCVTCQSEKWQVKCDHNTLTARPGSAASHACFMAFISSCLSVSFLTSISSCKTN